jgi:hypothetical protein
VNAVWKNNEILVVYCDNDTETWGTNTVSTVKNDGTYTDSVLKGYHSETHKLCNRTPQWKTRCHRARSKVPQQTRWPRWRSIILPGCSQRGATRIIHKTASEARSQGKRTHWRKPTEWRNPVLMRRTISFKAEKFLVRYAWVIWKYIETENNTVYARKYRTKRKGRQGRATKTQKRFFKTAGQKGWWWWDAFTFWIM